MNFEIMGLGLAQPLGCANQSEMAAAAQACSAVDGRQQKLLSSLYRRTTVRRRHSVLLTEAGSNGGVGAAAGSGMLAFYPPASGPTDRGPTTDERMHRYAEEAGQLACAASKNAMEEARVSASDIRQIVLVSCTGFSSPGVDFHLIDTLGLSSDVGRTIVGFMGCHGAMNGLRVARAVSAGLGDEGATLLCCVELCSLHFQYGWDPQRVVANALFGDGAAAIVGRSSKGHHPASLPEVVADGSCVLPDSRDLMTWQIGDHGFEMTLSAKVPDLVRDNLASWIEPWLQTQGLNVHDVGGWAIHPGGPRVISAVEQALDLPRDAGRFSREVLEHCGNMSSPTVLFILDRLRQAATPLPWVGLAFGPGLTIEAVLIR